MSIDRHYIPEEEFPKELAPGVHMLGNYFFNLFLIQGSDKSILYETAVSGVVDAVIQQVRQLGVTPDIIVPSHPHSDHITGLPGLREAFPKAELMAATGARAFVEHPKAGPLLIKEDGFISQGLERMDLPPQREPLAVIPDMADCREINQDTILDLGGRDIHLLTATGHSPGNLMAWLPKEGILFCADSLGFHYPGRGIWPLFFTGAVPYMETLEQIQKLKPAILCPAHQGSLYGKDATRAVELSLETTRELIRRIKTTDQGEEQLAKELFRESYKDEFTLYTEENIKNCSRLLIKRAQQVE